MQQSICNLLACVYYGVNTDEAIALRLLGVARGAAQLLSNVLGIKTRYNPLSQLHNELTQSDQNIWIRALGQDGQDYYRVCRILEGIS